MRRPERGSSLAILVGLAVGAWLAVAQPWTDGNGDGRMTATFPPLHRTTTTPYTATPLRLSGTVTKASDGDTLHVQARGQNITVRLLGVDTPETHDPRKPVQCYGPEAAAFTKDFALGRQATLRTEPTTGDVFDRYGRMLAYVSLRHVDLGATLLRRGYARVYAYANRHFARRPGYERLEAAAQTAHRGRWGACSG